LDSGIRLGNIFGIEIRAAFSWFIVFFLVTWSLAGQMLPRAHPGWSTTLTWLVGSVTSLLFFGSILAHELGHSLVANARGIGVRRITLFIFGGLAQIRSEPDTADDELAVAFAGPGVSAALAVVFWAVGVLLGSIYAPAATVATWLARINATVLVFNLVPGFPLDGGRVFRALAWKFTDDLRRATRYASLAGQAFAYLLIFGGLTFAFAGRFVDGLWLAFIGWFLLQAAVAGRKQVELREVMKDYRVSDLMQVGCPRLPASTTIEELVYDHILRESQQSFVVMKDEHVQGLVTVHHVKEVDKEEWPDKTIAEVMVPLDELRHVRPDDSLSAAFAQLADVSRLPVVDNGKLVGILSREHVMEFLQTRAELGLD